MEIEVVNNNNAKLDPLLVAKENDRAKRVQLQSRHRNLPRIRFQPDGFLSEIGPQALHLSGRDGESVYIAQSSNRLHYEIQSQLNLWNEVMR
jgi:hypothetical protein